MRPFHSRKGNHESGSNRGKSPKRTAEYGAAEQGRQSRLPIERGSTGLLGRETLLIGESERDLVAFGRRMRADLAPEGELELLLVDRLISNAWRLRRCLKMEPALLDWRRIQEYKEVSGFNLKNWADTVQTELGNRTSWEKLTRYEVALERSMLRSLHELERLRAARLGVRVIPPAVVDVTVSGMGSRVTVRE